MLRSQDNKCAICHLGTTKRLFVDHDHKTGMVRGLLCYKCNSALGLINDSTDIAESIKQYLLKSNTQNTLIKQISEQSVLLKNDKMQLMDKINKLEDTIENLEHSLEQKQKALDPAIGLALINAMTRYVDRYEKPHKEITNKTLEWLNGLRQELL
jgi:tetrahydromethanopterin S-methyltransferase subunit B